MNYAGLTRPLWRWLGDPQSTLAFPDMPLRVQRSPAPHLVATMTDVLAAIPWQARLASMNMLGSHDTARIRTVTGDPELVRVGAALLFTLPGIPAVFAGDEIGIEGINGESGRRPFPWKEPERWDRQTLLAYQALARVRRESIALQRGGLRWVHVSDDALAFLRETADEQVLVSVSRSAAMPVLPRRLSPRGGQIECLYGGDPRIDDDGIHVPGPGPGAHVWRLSGQ